MSAEGRDEDPDRERNRAERALERLERRVRDVRHLDPFEISRREDGRFSCDLQKPLADLTAGEGRALARALEELAEEIRRVAGDG